MVDDDDSLRAVLRGVLMSRGYCIVEAPDCRTALELLRSVKFDVVLLDITLPDRSGFEVLGYVSENQLSCKVIMITGTMGLENAMKSAARGVQDYITKPYTSNYLLRSIEHALVS